MLALSVALVVVGAVLAGVWAIVHFGQRAVLNPPTARTLRRIGLLGAGCGGLLLVSSVASAVATGDVVWLFHIAYGAFLLAHGVHTARTHRPVG